MTKSIVDHFKVDTCNIDKRSQYFIKEDLFLRKQFNLLLWHVYKPVFFLRLRTFYQVVILETEF